jgi:adenine-specific DNA-methyltransferase
MRTYRRYAANHKAVLHYGDSIDLLRTLPNESVHLTITSPPYCMGKEYEGTDKLEDFIEAHRRILPEIHRVTATGGSICWQVGYHVKNGGVMPLDFLVHGIMQSFPDLVLRNRIVWTYGHGLHCSDRLSGRHEVVMWYTKSENYTFNLDDIRVPQKYPGKRHYKGPLKGELSGNPLGKNPSDVWDIPNVKANHVEKTIHPCQFPVALAMQLVRAFTNAGNLVLDPFMGSGSTGVAALLQERRFVGAELLKKYYTVAERRCVEAIKGTAKYRSPDVAVYIPDLNTAVAQMPAQFRFALVNKTAERDIKCRKNGRSVHHA